jgi:hypothetical protein
MDVVTPEIIVRDGREGESTSNYTRFFLTQSCIISENHVVKKVYWPTMLLEVIRDLEGGSETPQVVFRVDVFSKISSQIQHECSYSCILYAN